MSDALTALAALVGPGPLARPVGPPPPVPPLPPTAAAATAAFGIALRRALLQVPLATRAAGTAGTAETGAGPAPGAESQSAPMTAPEEHHAAVHALTLPMVETSAATPTHGDAPVHADAPVRAREPLSPEPALARVQPRGPLPFAAPVTPLPEALPASEVTPPGSAATPPSVFPRVVAAPLPGAYAPAGTLRTETLGTERSMTALDPVFRERLARVIGRVEGELGLEVRVLETYRTPERQQALYAQGRTAPGPVVTWTRASRHSEGRAADVQLVGASPESAAYRQLGQIASEEGLRTLGARDPGHIELPRTTAEVAEGAGAALPTKSDRPAADPVERVLAIARGAGRAVPRAEDVRQLVAERFRASLAESRAPRAVAAAPIPVPAATPAAPVRTTGGRGTKPEEAPMPEPSPVLAERSALPTAAPAAPVAPTARDAGPEPPPLAPGAVQRVERVLSLQDAIAAQPVHSVLLRLDEGASPLAHIRVGLRGAVVDAAMDVTDPALARALREDLPELQRALQTRGLQSGPIESLRAAGLGAEAMLPAPVRTAEPGWKQEGDGSTPRHFQGHSRDPQHRQRNPRPKEEQP